jgi:hypothetical protein
MSVPHAIAPGINIRIAGLKVFIDFDLPDPADLQSCILGQLGVRTHPHGNQNHVCRDFPPIFQDSIFY